MVNEKDAVYVMTGVSSAATNAAAIFRLVLTQLSRIDGISDEMTAIRAAEAMVLGIEQEADAFID